MLTNDSFNEVRESPGWNICEHLRGETCPMGSDATASLAGAETRNAS